MAAFKGIKDMFSQMSKDIRLKTENLPDAVTEIFIDEGDEQANQMRQYIRDRRARTSPPIGRIRTWNMIDSVDSKASVGNTVVTVRTGYVGGVPEKDYYYYQDSGFIHKWAGWVEGTHAIYDSYNRTRSAISKRLLDLGLKGQAW